jgi:UDP-N-acetylglucosamine--N-acetylmuramyl-(pentapeptide) pyrophosphoryl-undecaprenol N-acetylglucosamine transferase
MGIPLALQEQNAYPGVTTRLLSRWSREIHLAFPEASEHLPSRVRSRTRLNGNPIRTPGEDSPREARRRLGLDPDAKVVLVTGGSQGASALNAAVLDAVRAVTTGEERLPDGTQLFWITGPRHLEAMEGALVKLGSPGWVRAVGYCDDMPTALRSAGLAVSRAGAMTTSELLAWGVPAILVPLPSAAADHQRHNAESLEGAGAAVHLPEAELTGLRLWRELLTIVEEPPRLDAMRNAALKRAAPEATVTIAQALAHLLPAGKEVVS